MSPSPASGQSKIWVGPDQGNWNDPDNWSPPGVPAAGDSTFIQCRLLDSSGNIVRRIGSDGVPSNESRPSGSRTK